MRAHVIENGLVTNTIEVSSLDFLPGLIDASLGGAIGDLWDGTKLSKPPATAKTRDELKAERQAAVDAIKVTTAAGNTFDGDEVSQGRMARGILGLQAAGSGATVTWVLADNTAIQVTAAELSEALALAGAAQAAVWVINE